MALAAILAYREQKKVMVLTNSYHGGTLSSVNGVNPPTNIPNEYIIGLYNNIEGTKSLIFYGIAAIIVEQLQSAGGMTAATKEFLLFLCEAANTLIAVFIFDEVVTARLDYHGFQGYHWIKPDMTTLSKFIGGGFSFGCFGGSCDIMRRFDPNIKNVLSHSGTFNNVSSMTAEIAGLSLATAPKIARINALGDRVRISLNKLANENELKGVISATVYSSVIGDKFHSASGELYRDLLYYEINKRITIGRRRFIFFNLAHTDEGADQLIEVITEIIKSIPDNPL